MNLTLGAAAPDFEAPSPVNPRFVFSSVAGRYVLLVFLPGPGQLRDAALAEIARHRPFDDRQLAVFGVLPDRESFEQACNVPRSLRWFGDWTGAVRGRFRAVGPDGDVAPRWLLLDPALRVLAWGDLDEIARPLQWARTAGPPEAHAGVPLNAPVLIVPRVLEPDFCRQLIAAYAAVGGQPSGVMRERDGKVVGVVDDFKRRKDATLPEGPLVEGLRQRLAVRLLPQIRRAFQFEATRIERFIVACYEAEDGGYFRPHRDDTTPATAHRRFAVSINLNAEAFEGGDLRFPEYGDRTYRPPTGGAVVFSCKLLHEALPVTAGRRYAILPFLYDETGEQIRQANLHTLRTEPA
jgi:predicted 2-oxoglutarate/Fe(II)-dependent dioxygenase YbiX